mmetsp:Transcript_21088/g.32677  ORF Transcript_21088/g.32677 Transcript_21088/m.32677 type:complete len:107 (+) Transcript_21088:24-344(+)
MYDIDCSKKKSRKLLWKIPTENKFAKAYWQYAILCVIRDNRQKKNKSSYINEFEISPSLKQKYFKVLQLLMAKVATLDQFFIIQKAELEKKQKPANDLLATSKFET